MGKKGGGLAASSKKVDPTLNALFAASSGPVQAPSKSRYSVTAISESKPKKQISQQDKDIADDEDLSEGSEELDYEDDEDQDDASEKSVEDAEEAKDDVKQEPKKEKKDTKPAVEETSKRERKRKRKDDHDDLEDKYLSKLADDDVPEHIEKRSKIDLKKDDEASDDEELPQHESLNKESKNSELEKADRTVFLANVSTDAISSKSAKKTLITHLTTILDKDASPAEKFESIRFRSVAFSGGSMPKRAAYITKQLMEATTKSTNAYAVFSTPAAARKVAKELNGTEVLGRHIRIDNVAHPTPTDHRRCVFVGNLGFVDDETVLNTDEAGNTVEKKRNKVPSDIEEGLWRTFGTQGKVENVRVIRDPKTRVGKGFAYVQFYDANAVESALHLEGKKFPPMLPRALRVSRAKDPRKTALAQERANDKKSAAAADGKGTKYKKKLTPEEKSMVGRAGKLLGRSGAVAERRRASGKEFKSRDQDNANTTELGGKKSPEQIVFEGMRASSKYGKPNNLRLGKKSKGKKGGKPMGRGAKRAAEWKKKAL